MKRLTIILSVIIVCASAAGCSQPTAPEPSLPASSSTGSLTPSPAPTPSPTPPPFTIELADLPEEYQPDTAAANGDYVQVHGMEFYNEEKLTAFIDAAAAKQNAALRTVGYTDEGDPCINDVIYDGNKFSVWYDNTRDQYGVKGVYKFEYSNILEYELEDGRIWILLSNENKVNKEMLEDQNNEYYVLTLKRNPDVPVSE